MESVVIWASERVRDLQWPARESQPAPFYKRLSHHREPGPQPDYPELEITF